MPRSETVVMISTVVVVVATHNLAIGVVVGVVIAALLFARRVAHLAEVTREIIENTGDNAGYGAYALYTVSGELFFASSNDFYSQFDYGEDPARIVIDFSDSHIWDASTVAALDAVTTKYEGHGAGVEVRGLNQASQAMYERLTGHLAGSH